MSLQRIQTNKEFSRDIILGMITLVSLSGILIFVAVQRFTGRSLSPLAYLYSQSEDESKSVPVTVFATEKDRLAARASGKNQPSIDDVAKKIKRITRSVNNNDGLEAKSIQLASHQSNVSETAPENKQFTASRPLSAAASNRSFQPERLSTNLGEFKPISTPEIPSKFQPGPTISSTSPKTDPPKSFSTNDRIRRFQSPETSVQNNLTLNPSFQEPKSPSSSLRNRRSDFSISKPIEAPSGDRKIPQKNTEPAATVETDKSSTTESILNPLDKRIQPEQDDSFWTIANREYGDGRLFRQLASYNKCLENSDIMPRIVLIPDVKTLQMVKVEIKSDRMLKDSASGSPTPLDSTAVGPNLETKYIVQEGDTLFEISKQKLDQAVRFVEIIRLNQDILPSDVDGQTKLQVGLELVMPK